MYQEISGISKSFDSNTLYTNLTIRLTANTFNILVGRNAVGKTTLLKIISGKLNSDTIMSNPFKKIMFFDSTFNFIPYISGVNNIKFFLSSINIKISKHEIYSIANYLGLNKEDMDNLLYNYSLGMKEKLQCLLIYFSEGFDLVLLDEPFSSLDKYSFTSVMELFNQCNKTFLITTHMEEIIRSINSICKNNLIVLNNKGEITYEPFEEYIK